MSRSLFRLLRTTLLALVLFAGCQKDEEFITPLAQPGDIVILYDNDVHCAIDGYAKMAWLKKSILNQTEDVCVVSCGDFLQGDAYGLLSQGEYPVTLMNAVGYDFVTLGNHEFDYAIPRLHELTDILHAEVLCANFVYADSQAPVYTTSTIKQFGSARVAFIGIATPSTITSSTPAFFMDNEGHMQYSFCEANLIRIVQHEVDLQRRAGVDYVVVLSHLGDEEAGSFTSQQLISNTTGIDVLLDGHAHHVIPCDSVRNKVGKYIKRSSTGTKFQNIGKLTITSQGSISMELLATELIADDPQVKQATDHIKQKLDNILSEEVGVSLVTLSINDAEGNRIVRNHETNIGDWAADAFRDYFGSDIAWVNGGGLRTDITAGKVDFSDILAVSPYGNQTIYGTITGQMLLDNLEMAYRRCPVENGGFAQLAGVRCTIDTSIASSVVLDGNNVLLSVGSTRRVKNVQVYNRATGNYESLNPSRTYTIAGTIYVLQNHGDGQNFDGIRLINNHPVLTDAEIMARYVKETLGGTIGSQYGSPQGRITIAQ